MLNFKKEDMNGLEESDLFLYVFYGHIIVYIKLLG